MRPIARGHLQGSRRTDTCRARLAKRICPGLKVAVRRRQSDSLNMAGRKFEHLCKFVQRLDRMKTQRMRRNARALKRLLGVLYPADPAAPDVGLELGHPARLGALGKFGRTQIICPKPRFFPRDRRAQWRAESFKPRACA